MLNAIIMLLFPIFLMNLRRNATLTTDTHVYCVFADVIQFHQVQKSVYAKHVRRNYLQDTFVCLQLHDTSAPVVGRLSELTLIARTSSTHTCIYQRAERDCHSLPHSLPPGAGLEVGYWGQG